MAVVAGVLLDHVNQKLPQGDGLTRTISSNQADIGLGGGPIGPGNLVTPRGPRLIDDCLIGHRPVEVTVGLVVGLVAVGDGLARTVNGTTYAPLRPCAAADRARTALTARPNGERADWRPAPGTSAAT